MSALFPTWRGMATRPMWRDGSDVCQCNDSWLAAKMADQVIFREMTHNTINADETPGCWSAAFRGALRTLNERFWQLNLNHRSN